MNVFEKLEEIENKIASELNDHESRGLFLVNENEKVQEYIIENVNSEARFNTQMYIEIGYNYSDSTALTFAFFMWHPSFKFDLLSLENNSRLNIDQLQYVARLHEELNANASELYELFQLYIKEKHLCTN